MSAETKDKLGLSHYRADIAFFAGYIFLLAGLLLFGWDPRYVFLAVAIELAAAVVASLVKAYLSVEKPMFALGAVFMSPALALAGLFAALAVAGAASGAEISLLGLIGLAAFIACEIYSRYRRFRNTTMKQIRFVAELNRKYSFADGRAVMPDSSKVIGAIVETWLVTIVFVVSWGIAALVGAVTSAPTDAEVPDILTRPAAVTIALLSMLRELAVVGIVSRVYRPGVQQEQVWLARFRRMGPIVQRGAEN